MKGETGMLLCMDLGGTAVKLGLVDDVVPHSILLELFTDSGIGTMVLPE